MRLPAEAGDQPRHCRTDLHILHKLNVLNNVNMRPAIEAKWHMTRKDKWMTEGKVAAECEKVLAEGTPLSAINANMIIDRLNTKSRATVYKYVDAWRTGRTERATIQPFALAHDKTQKLVAVFTGMLGDIVIEERQTAADLVASADQRATASEEALQNLLATLEATEGERDYALQLVDEMEEKLIKAVIAADAHMAIANEAKAERNAILDKYLPWSEANPDPKAD